VLGKVDKSRSKLKIIIEDTGVGMTRDQLASLFTNFTKIMDNRELNKEGVGLGLTISKNIAQAMKGDIEVKSLVGVGSKFILTLPMSKKAYSKRMTGTPDSLS
jgi:signal transduction histidine kinase